MLEETKKEIVEKVIYNTINDFLVSEEFDDWFWDRINEIDDILICQTDTERNNIHAIKEKTIFNIKIVI